MPNKRERRPVRDGAVKQQQPDHNAACIFKQALEDLDITSACHDVGLGFSVVFPLRNGFLKAKWTPDYPNVEIQRRLGKNYRVVRGAFGAEIARLTGGDIILAEALL